MLNFKNEYFTLEKGRTKYPTQFKDKSFLVVYGSKEGGVTGTELTAHIYKIPENYYEINAGQLDFSNYPNGIENDFLTIRVTNLDSLFSLPLNFTDWKDISPENLTTTFEKIGVSILDIQKRLSEVSVYIDSGKPNQINLPKLPVGCTWYKDQDDNIVALPISDLYGKFQQMIDSLHKTIKDLLDIDYGKLSDELRKETDKLLKELEELKKQCVLDVTTEGEKQLEILNQASAGLPNRVTALENKTTQNRKELEDLINTARTENIQPSRIVDNSISSSKLKIATDEDKIKLVNLSDEVKKAMTGDTPVSPTLQKDSVVREYIADMAIDKSKLDNSIYTSFYNVDITREWNTIEVLTIEESTELANETLEISYISDTMEMGCKIYSKLDVSQDVELVKSIVKFGELTKYTYTSKQPINLKFSKIKIGNLSPLTSTIKGLFSNFEVKKNGKTIPVKLKLEKGIIEKQYTGSIVDYELLLKEIYNRKIGLNDFSKEDKLKSIGKTEDKYVSILERTDVTNYLINAFSILNKQLKPGKYKISSSEIFYVRILVFEKATGGEVLKTFDLTKDNNEFILENNSFIGILISNDSTFKTPDDKLWFNSTTEVKKVYHFNLFKPSKMFSVGDVVSEKADTNSIFYTSAYSLEFTPVYSLSTKTLLEDMEVVKTELKNKNVRLEPIFKKNIEQILKDNNFKVTNVSDRTMTGFSNINYPYYNVIDSWKYKAKFKLNDIQSIVGISSINGEEEQQSILIDTEKKQLIFGDEIRGAVQTLEERPLNDRIGIFGFEDKATTFITTQPINIEGVEFVVGHTYLLSLERNGLEMIVEVIDCTTDKSFIFSSSYKRRFHGGLSFLVQKGEITFYLLEWQMALYKGAKAVFLGDSISEGLGMGVGNVHYSYNSLIRDNYFDGNAILCGRGYGTTGSVKVTINNLDYYNKGIEYYFVMIGTNQSSSKDVPKWKKEIVEIYDLIVQRGGMPIIIIPPLSKSGTEYILQMRDFILEKGWDTIRMDIATSTGDGITFDSSLSTDGTHFNVNGNQKMYERALIDLKKIM